MWSKQFGFCCGKCWTTVQNPCTALRFFRYFWTRYDLLLLIPSVRINRAFPMAFRTVEHGLSAPQGSTQRYSRIPGMRIHQINVADKNRQFKTTISPPVCFGTDQGGHDNVKHFHAAEKKNPQKKPISISRLVSYCFWR